MCGSKLRHLTFALKILEQFPKARIFIEDHIEQSSGIYTRNPTTLIEKHFEEFAHVEKNMFERFVMNNKNKINSQIIRRTPFNTINSIENVNFLKKLNPKLLLIHSTTLLKEEIVNYFSGRIINLHAGLSPYYRGSGTNLYPLVNKEPEYIGMTVHYIDLGIDSGNIILQGRPKIEVKDNVHTLGCKCLLIGAKLMNRVAAKFLENNSIESTVQDMKKGKLYLKKHFTDAVIHQLHENMKNGLIENYIKNPKTVEIIN
jgi:methionyl-tRNA formyltransferase